MNLWQTIIGAFVIHGLILATVLFSKFIVSKKAPYILLGLVLLFYSIALLEGIFYWTGWYHDYPHILGISFVFPLLYGPIFWFYYRFTLDKPVSSYKKVAYHFVLPISELIYLIPFYLQSGD